MLLSVFYIHHAGMFITIWCFSFSLHAAWWRICRLWNTYLRCNSIHNHIISSFERFLILFFIFTAYFHFFFFFCFAPDAAILWFSCLLFLIFINVILSSFLFRVCASCLLLLLDEWRYGEKKTRIEKEHDKKMEWAKIFSKAFLFFFSLILICFHPPFYSFLCGCCCCSLSHATLLLPDVDIAIV